MRLNSKSESRPTPDDQLDVRSHSMSAPISARFGKPSSGQTKFTARAISLKPESGGFPLTSNPDSFRLEEPGGERWARLTAWICARAW
jgi:hypothetical protein